MRTTLDIDDVVLSAARAKARADGVSVGRALSELAMQTLTRRPDCLGDAEEFPTLHGVPGHVVTDELIAQYRDHQ